MVFSLSYIDSRVLSRILNRISHNMSSFSIKEIMCLQNKGFNLLYFNYKQMKSCFYFVL
jgi:hypothetical protein